MLELKAVNLKETRLGTREPYNISVPELYRGKASQAQEEPGPRLLLNALKENHIQGSVNRCL